MGDWALWEVDESQPEDEELSTKEFDDCHPFFKEKWERDFERDYQEQDYRDC